MISNILYSLVTVRAAKGIYIEHNSVVRTLSTSLPNPTTIDDGTKCVFF